MFSVRLCKRQDRKKKRIHLEHFEIRFERVTEEDSLVIDQLREILLYVLESRRNVFQHVLGQTRESARVRVERQLEWSLEEIRDQKKRTE